MENEHIYKRLRNIPSFKSAKFLKWFKAKYPDREAHHIIGSMTGIKLNDYLLLPVTREEHYKAEAYKTDYAIDNLHISLKILFEYIKELEND